MIIIYIFIYFTVSSAFINIIDEKTKIKINEDHFIKYYPDPYIFLIILFGPISYFFLNKIRKWRKIRYYKYKLKQLKKYKDYPFMILNDDQDYNTEVLKLERKIKMKKLNNKK